MLGDIASEAKSWEDVSMKVLLLVAVVFLVRLLLKREAENEAKNADREKRVLDALNRSADSMDELMKLTKEQTDYYKAVTRNIVAERLNVKPSLPE